MNIFHRIFYVALTFSFLLAHDSAFSSALDADGAAGKDQTQSFLLPDRDVKKEELIAFFPEGMRRATAGKILSKIYEVNKRDIVAASDALLGIGHGFSFCCNPEFLKHLIQNSLGRNICGIAEARGEMMLLCLLAGASRVVVNDLSDNEIDSCRKIFEEAFPAELQEEMKGRLEFAVGDCLSALEDNDLSPTKYTQQFDYVVARNIIHFLEGDEVHNFMKTLNRLVRPGGFVHLTSNCLYGYADAITCIRCCQFALHGDFCCPLGGPVFVGTEKEDAPTILSLFSGFVRSEICSVKRKEDGEMEINVREEYQADSELLACAKSIMDAHKEMILEHADRKETKEACLVFSEKDSVRIYSPQALVKRILSQFGVVSILVGNTDLDGHVLRRQPCLNEQLFSCVTVQRHLKDVLP